MQSDVGDFYDELPVAILRAHSWWDEAFKKHGFQVAGCASFFHTFLF